MKQGNSILAICLHAIIDDSLADEKPEMKQLITHYNDLFHEPSQLPPPREIDHHINLKDSMEPVNVQPNRYAYFQNAKIEKQVQNMLKLGLI